MRTIEIMLPDGIEIEEHDLTMIVAARLYEKGKLSSGQAAQVAGLSKRAFIELLGRVFSQSVDDLHSDIANA